MHLYWRIKEELRNMGEVLIFNDPSLSREYGLWIQKRSGALTYNSMDCKPFVSPDLDRLKLLISRN